MTVAIPSVRMQDLAPGVQDQPSLPVQKIWERTSPFHRVGGRRPTDSPEDLWNACCDYFDWATDNPLKRIQTYSNEGQVIAAEVPKLRAFTKQGLFLFLKISSDTWAKLEKGLSKTRSEFEIESFRRVTETVNNVIFEQKFTAAAADLLNSTLISRELGLADRRELTGPNGGPIEVVVQYQLPDNGRVPIPEDIEDAELVDETGRDLL